VAGCSIAPPGATWSSSAAFARIVGDVRVRGDRALLSYAKKHDGLTGSPEITRARWSVAPCRWASDVVARCGAARSIRHVARRQVRRLDDEPGGRVTIEQRVAPLERVGCYVPGGRYPLPSSS